MYQGKHVKSAHARNRHVRSKKATVLLTSLVLLLTCVIGTTAAYLLDKTDPVNNTFTPAEVSCVVNEESFANDIKENVTIANTSNIPAYIRAAIIVTWKDQLGNVYGAKPVLGQDYTMTLNLTDDQNVIQWIKGSDGYYYYNYPVPVSGSTAVLIKRCEPVANMAPKGYGLNVEIVASAIQADGMNAATAQSAWATAGIASQGGQS